VLKTTKRRSHDETGNASDFRALFELVGQFLAFEMRRARLPIDARHVSTLMRVQSALESAGIRFIDNEPGAGSGFGL
jgi:hypothetical protein